MPVKTHMNPPHIKYVLTPLHPPHPFLFTHVPFKECGEMRLLIFHQVLSCQFTTSCFSTPLLAFQWLTTRRLLKWDSLICLGMELFFTSRHFVTWIPQTHQTENTHVCYPGSKMNKLPTDIRTAETLYIFRCQLKIQLFRLYF